MVTSPPPVPYPTDEKCVGVARALTFGMTLATLLLAGVLAMISITPAPWAHLSPNMLAGASVAILAVGYVASRFARNYALRTTVKAYATTTEHAANSLLFRQGFVGQTIFWLTPLESAGLLAGAAAMLTGREWLAAFAVPAAALMLLHIPSRSSFDDFVRHVAATPDPRHVR